MAFSCFILFETIGSVGGTFSLAGIFGVLGVVLRYMCECWRVLQLNTAVNTSFTTSGGKGTSLHHHRQPPCPSKSAATTRTRARKLSGNYAPDSSSSPSSSSLRSLSHGQSFSPGNPDSPSKTPPSTPSTSPPLSFFLPTFRSPSPPITLMRESASTTTDLTSLRLTITSKLLTLPESSRCTKATRITTSGLPLSTATTFRWRRTMVLR
ncbi:hypothetical protein L2E82_34785 [Cichorium intybus]|uniref:Uncharacterized protein n=1 Tax=Cichorium intybus TaxID=13427 RepID=A0ACB9BMR1_CICIN|nr:hypothetical protein L2E82_34785 [Cichorium intybus]